MEASERLVQDYTQLNGSALAYIGDGVYEVFVRRYIIESGITQPNRLHKAATRYVSANGQALAIQTLRDSEQLSEAELDIYKRGRNHKANTKAKNASIGTYRQATGFEAVVGWLYLTQQSERLQEFMTLSVQIIEKGMKQSETKK